MAKEHDLFLDNYRLLEGILREKKNGQTIKEYEDELVEKNKDEYASKLRLCRTIRNYISHEKDGSQFVAIAPKMNEFIRTIIEDLDDEQMQVGKKMISITKCLIEDDLVSNACDMLKKKKIDSIPFFDKNGNFVGVFSNKSLQNAIILGKISKATKLKNILEECKYTKKDYVVISKKDTLQTAREYIRDGLSVLVESDEKQIVGIYV